MPSLLISEVPILVSPTLAARIGLNEAIFLQQLHYWLQKSPHIQGGKRWIYNSYENWQKQFPFWSKPTIKRIVAKLKELDLIDIKNFNRSKFDKTNWYTINHHSKLLHSQPREEKQAEADDREYQDDTTRVSSCNSLDGINLIPPIPETTTEITTEKDTFSKEKVCPTSNEVDPPPHPQNVPFKKIFELWNQKVQNNDSVLPRLRGIKPNTQRWRFIRSRWKDFPDIKIWEEVFEKATTSSFLNGNNKRGFTASFDWVIKSPNNFLKVLEGNYSDKKPSIQTEHEGTLTWEDLVKTNYTHPAIVAEYLKSSVINKKTIPSSVLKEAEKLITNNAPTKEMAEEAIREIAKGKNYTPCNSNIVSYLFN